MSFVDPDILRNAIAINSFTGKPFSEQGPTLSGPTTKVKPKNCMGVLHRLFYVEGTCPKCGSKGKDMEYLLRGKMCSKEKEPE